MNSKEIAVPRGRPTAAQTEQVPGRLLDAATWLFVHRGFGKTSMEAIAKRAGASTKTVYSRFANKEAVLRAVVRRMFDQAVDAALANGSPFPDDPREFLLQVGQDLAALSADPATAGVNRLIMAEAFQVPELAELFLELHERASALVREPLVRWRDEGRVRALGDPETSAALFVEMTASIPRLWSLLGRPLERAATERLVEEAVDLFLAGIDYVPAGPAGTRSKAPGRSFEARPGPPPL